MKGRILMLAHDPGGANAVGAVARVLLRRGQEVILYGHGPALQRYSSLGLQGLDLSRIAANPELGAMRKLIHIEQPDLVVTGTSGDDFAERYLWQASGQCGVTSIAILDQWANFGFRFSPYSLAERDRYLETREHPYKPDYVCVMDEDARREIIADGIEAERIVIGGMPYLDVLAEKLDTYGSGRLEELRRELGIGPDETVLTYVSESIRQDYRVAEDDPPYWGYDEISIFLEIIDGLAPVLRTGISLKMFIKLHPLERENGYAELIPNIEQRYPGLKIKAVQKIEPHDLIMVSDLVIGMSSMMLMESCLFSRPTISVQIGLSRDNPFILEQKGIMSSITTREDLARILWDALVDGRPPVCGSVKAGAAERISEFVEGLLCQS